MNHFDMFKRKNNPKDKQHNSSNEGINKLGMREGQQLFCNNGEKVIVREIKSKTIIFEYKFKYYERSIDDIGKTLFKFNSHNQIEFQVRKEEGNLFKLIDKCIIAERIELERQEEEEHKAIEEFDLLKLEEEQRLKKMTETERQQEEERKRKFYEEWKHKEQLELERKQEEEQKKKREKELERKIQAEKRHFEQLALKEKLDDERRKTMECPKCGAMNSVRIIYGYPGHELLDDAEAGKIILGGCNIIIGEEMPQYFCKDCKHEW